MRGLVLLVAALLTASGAGQGRSADQPFSIHVSPARQTVDAGSGIGIEIVLTNTSAEPLDCSANINDMTGQDPNFEIDVQDDHGRPVPRRAYAHPELAEGHPVMNCSIAPGRSRAVRQEISRIFDMAKPGKYTIQVSRPISFTNPKAGVVTSNTVTVEVVTPPFSLRISAPSAEVKAGSPIPLNIRLTNISGGELVFGAPPKTGGVDSHFAYICRKDGVKDMSRGGMLSLDTSPKIKLKSGVSHEQEVDIASACDLSQPGVYRIQLVRYDPVDRKRGVVRSNEITLTVKPQHNDPSVQRRGGDHDRAGGERGPSAEPGD